MHAMRHLPLGTANCFQISCTEGTYFFKEYQKGFHIQDVKRETELVEYLYSNGFPVARFIGTVTGDSCILFEGHVISIQEYLEGESYLNDLPHDLLKESLLTKVHNLPLKDSKRNFDESQRQVIYRKDKGICQICGKECDWNDWEADHIVPWSKGGKTEIENGQVLCPTCNSKKSDTM